MHLFVRGAMEHLISGKQAQPRDNREIAENEASALCALTSFL